jgi:hypothetical protein
LRAFHTIVSPADRDKRITRFDISIIKMPFNLATKFEKFKISLYPQFDKIIAADLREPQEMPHSPRSGEN